MNTPDQDTVLRAVEDARQILREYDPLGSLDARRTVERLFVVLDRDELVNALHRMRGRPDLRLVDPPA